MLGEDHPVAGQPRQEEPLAGGVRRVEQRAGWNLVVSRDVGDQRGAGRPDGQLLDARAHRRRGGSQVEWPQRAPSRPHRLSDRCFCPLHPDIEFSIRDG